MERVAPERARVSARMWVGTSGYSFDEWKGNFYPEKLAAKDRLRFYATKLETVEINNTFYRMPTERLLAGWLAEVPERFRFAIKSPQRITHMRRLNDCAESVTRLVDVITGLGPRLGPLLYQLPPNFKKDLPRLQAFLDGVPRPEKVAFEFRNKSWFDDETFDTLRKHKVALVVSDTGEEPVAPLVPTADWGYLRLRREEFDDRSLGEWARRIREQPWAEAFVFVKHEEEGKGPQFAARLRELYAA
jgi:uncharacterized protein YecE (DUF72 family)